MKTKEQLIEDLRIAEENIKLDLIKKNPKLLPSLKEKIAELKEQIKSYQEEDVEPKVKAPKVEKPIAIKEPKVEKPKVEKPAKFEKPKVEKKPKEKAEKPKVEKAEKKSGYQNDNGLKYFEGKFKIGQIVQFDAKGFDNKLSGTLKSLKNTKQEDGTYSVNAFVTLKDGSVKKVRAVKLS
jgi:hypothetical protein